MSDIVKKTLRKIRGTHLPPLEIQPLTEGERLRIDNYALEFWERDKKTVRAQNFEKAKLALEEYRKAQSLEKERQAKIAKDRLKNLKKARKVKNAKYITRP